MIFFYIVLWFKMVVILFDMVLLLDVSIMDQQIFLWFYTNIFYMIVLWFKMIEL